MIDAPFSLAVECSCNELRRKLVHVFSLELSKAKWQMGLDIGDDHRLVHLSTLDLPHLFAAHVCEHSSEIIVHLNKPQKELHQGEICELKSVVETQC